MKYLKLSLLAFALFFFAQPVDAQITVVNSGRVGIGTSTPVSGLHIARSEKSDYTPGAGVFIDGGPSGNANIELRNNGSGTPYIDFANDPNTADYDVRLRLTGNNALALEGGNLGIGTSSPTAELHLGNDSHFRLGPWDMWQQGGGNITSYLHISRWTGNGQTSWMEHRITFDWGGRLALGSAVTHPSYQLYVVGNSYATGSWVSSDSRFKQNVRPISNSLDMIKQMNPVSYEFRTEEFKDRNLPEGSTMGFLAQELKEVAPDVVMEDEEGWHAVNYDAIIPVLTQAIKDQQAQIEALQAQLNDLQSGPAGKQSPAGDDLLRGIELYQNAPNPFNEETAIRFHLPETINTAQLLVFDLTGLQVMDIELEDRGEASVLISGSELNAGMYIYSLIADGKEMDTKRMILTK